MANSRDFTGKNRKFTGTKGIVVAKGTTGQRVGSESGELRFNTTTELMEYYDGNQWKPIDAPPSISSISTSDAQGTNNILNADGSTLHTITITGGNFGVGVTVKFIGNTGTEYAAGNVTRVSNSSITCKTTASMGTADDPYDIQVTNTSGLAATLEDAFSFNAAPVFTNASGTLGQVYNGQVISGTTLNAGATDAEGNTITFTIISGSLPGSGLTISSSTGAITGTLAGTPSLGNYPFVVRAATTEGTVERQFSIQVIAFPGITATGGTTTTVGSYKYHTFNDSGNFVVSSAGSAPFSTVDYLLVAGGGGGGPNYHGAGGGAGGAIDSTFTVSATTYALVLGGGGSGGSAASPGSGQTDGTNSTLFSQTAVAGGKGGNYAGAGSGTGGSGGGGAQSSASPGVTGAAGTPGQGNNGGNTAPDGESWLGGGGGGGKGAVGGNGSGNGVESNCIAGGGGVGINWKSLGTFYAGGGAGSRGGTAPSTASGAGGGGTPSSAGTGVNGVANTGGGGGAGERNPVGPGGSGGKGVCIIRYLIS